MSLRHMRRTAALRQSDGNLSLIAVSDSSGEDSSTTAAQYNSKTQKKSVFLAAAAALSSDEEEADEESPPSSPERASGVQTAPQNSGDGSSSQSSGRSRSKNRRKRRSPAAAAAAPAAAAAAAAAASAAGEAAATPDAAAAERAAAASSSPSLRLDPSEERERPSEASEASPSPPASPAAAAAAAAAAALHMERAAFDVEADLRRIFGREISRTARSAGRGSLRSRRHWLVPQVSIQPMVCEWLRMRVIEDNISGHFYFCVEYTEAYERAYPLFISAVQSFDLLQLQLFCREHRHHPEALLYLSQALAAADRREESFAVLSDAGLGFTVEGHWFVV
ncbi:uncharacterized protein EMH_0073350 [Eimeria mitis]|uniref:Uncharacterized protein n=1 Tax=Eimeria mitis TaxID=44415 RepID=U6KBQ9_9EIME|nr:uncharacterized protein EMH_0073350 [Eimeria mitis]CDJ35450.1 hypothetical protein, conserved [Eimeria mitis]